MTVLLLGGLAVSFCPIEQGSAFGICKSSREDEDDINGLANEKETSGEKPYYARAYLSYIDTMETRGKGHRQGEQQGPQAFLRGNPGRYPVIIDTRMDHGFNEAIGDKDYKEEQDRRKHDQEYHQDLLLIIEISIAQKDRGRDGGYQTGQQ